MSEPGPSKVQSTTPAPPRWLLCILLIAAALTLVAFRIHAFDLPLETDECNYAYIAARLLEGQRLYVDVWDHQPPGIFILFAGVIALFGDAPVVFRLLACASSLISLALIFAITRKLVGPWPAVAAAFLFAIVSADPGTAGEGCQREIYMNTLILAAWYLVLRSDEATRPRSHEGESNESHCYSSVTGERKDPLCSWSVGQVLAPAATITSKVANSKTGVTGGLPARGVGRAICPPSFCCLFTAGLCLGLASLIKTVVAVHWLALAIFLVIMPLRDTSAGSLHTPGATGADAPGATGGSSASAARRNTDTSDRVWPGALIRLLSLAAGPAIVWTATFTYFALTDRWIAFTDAVFTFNLGYSGDQSLPARLMNFFTPDRHPFTFDSAFPLWIAGAVAALITAAHLIIRKDARSLNILLLIAASFVAVCLPGRSWPHYYYLMIPPLVIATAYAATALLYFFKAPTTSAAKKNQTALTALVLMVVFLITLYTQYRDYLSQPPFGLTVKRYNSRDFWGRGQGENVKRATNPDDNVFVFGNEASIYYYADRRCASRYTMITGLADGMPGAERRRTILMEELRADPPRLILVLFDQQPFDEWKAFLNEHYGQPAGWDLHDKSRQPIMFVLARKNAPIEPIDWDWDRSSVGGWHLGKKER